MTIFRLIDNPSNDNLRKYAQENTFPNTKEKEILKIDMYKGMVKRELFCWRKLPILDDLDLLIRKLNYFLVSIHEFKFSCR